MLLFVGLTLLLCLLFIANLYANILSETLYLFVIAFINISVCYLTNLPRQEFIENFLVIWVCIGGPILEELIFRRYLPYELSFLEKDTVIIVCSVLFGLIHLLNCCYIEQHYYYYVLNQLIVTTILGYIIGHVDNILIDILFHMIYNILGVIAVKYLYKKPICFESDTRINIRMPKRSLTFEYSSDYTFGYISKDNYAKIPQIPTYGNSIS